MSSKNRYTYTGRDVLRPDGTTLTNCENWEANLLVDELNLLVLQRDSATRQLDLLDEVISPVPAITQPNDGKMRLAVSNKLTLALSEALVAWLARYGANNCAEMGFIAVDDATGTEDKFIVSVQRDSGKRPADLADGYRAERDMARAESHECRKLLSLAREQYAAVRKERDDARAKLASVESDFAAFRETADEINRAYHVAHSERYKLNERVAVLDRDLDQIIGERDQLAADIARLTGSEIGEYERLCVLCGKRRGVMGFFFFFGVAKGGRL